MTDADRLQATRLFIAALSKVTTTSESIPFEPRTFAEVVDKLRNDGNSFATRFMVYETVAGKNCPDFQAGMTAAQSAGLIARQNPTYQFFSVRMASRTAKELLRTQELVTQEAVSRVAREYCLALGTSLQA